MRNPITILPLALALVGCLLGGADAHAADKPHAKPITMQQAEAIALARVPGGVVEDTEREREHGKLIYEIEVRAPDGRELTFEIDAADGRVLSEERDD